MLDTMDETGNIKTIHEGCRDKGYRTLGKHIRSGQTRNSKEKELGIEKERRCEHFKIKQEIKQQI